MKIVYVLPALTHYGGAERIVVEKANYMAKILNYDVYIINLFQDDNTANCFHLHEKVKQINLSIPYHIQYLYKYPKRLWKKTSINAYMRKTLTQTILSISPDILVGVSYSKAELVSTLQCNAKKVIECHEPRAFHTSNIIKGSLISKFYLKHFYFKAIEKYADMIVTLTEEDKKQWNKAKRVEVIPNFSTMQIIRQSACEAKRVIAVGRLREEKGFERLISIWKVVSENHSDWQLDIYGEGPLMHHLTNLIKNDHVHNVTLRGKSDNISQEYATSSICVVTSHLEGFSIVILEALKHGLPCIAFDCPYGPRNIIEDRKCGFLIEDGNNNQFIEKLNTLIEDEQLRQHFSYAAIERARHFDTDTIMKQWKELFESLLAQ